MLNPCLLSEMNCLNMQSQDPNAMDTIHEWKMDENREGLVLNRRD